MAPWGTTARLIDSHEAHMNGADNARYKFPAERPHAEDPFRLKKYYAHK